MLLFLLELYHMGWSSIVKAKGCWIVYEEVDKAINDYITWSH